jgi:muconolactone D-isomerase
MQFLVRIQVDLPASLSADERSELLAAELKRGRELRDSGAIVSIWRVPGPPLRNVGIWEAADATELHKLLASLPLFPFIQTEVTPLAQHPINANDEGD